MSASTEPHAQQLTPASKNAKSEAPINVPPRDGEAVESLTAVRRPKTPKPAVRPFVVDVDLVDEDPDNARIEFDQAGLKTLGASLKQRQEKPISVRSAPGGRFRLMDGARRLRAAKLAGLKQLRAEDWGELDEKTAALAAATANLVKEDLTPYEEARAYDRLLKAKVPKKEICETFDIPFNTLQDRLGLLELPEIVAQRVGDARGGALFGLGHAKALLPLAKHPKLLEAALKAFDEAPEIPSAKQAPAFVFEAILESGLVGDPDDDFGWQWRTAAKDTAAAVDKLPAIELDYYNQTRRLVVDLDGYAKVRQQHEAAAKAEEAKEMAAVKSEREQAKVDPAKQKALREKERKAREIEELAKPITLRHKASALAHELLTATGRGKIAWHRLATWFNEDVVDEDALVALAKPLKLGEDDVRKTFAAFFSEDSDELDPKTPPAWFTKAKPEQQLGFFVGCWTLADYGFQGDAIVVKELTGITHARFHSGAINEAREEIAKRDAQAARDAKEVAGTDWKTHERHLKCGMCNFNGVVAPNAKKCPKCGCRLPSSLTFTIQPKATSNLKSGSKAHEGRDAPGKPAPANRSAPAPTKGKKPVVEPAGVAKARAKMAKKGA